MPLQGQDFPYVVHGGGRSWHVVRRPPRLRDHLSIRLQSESSLLSPLTRRDSVLLTFIFLFFRVLAVNSSID